MTIGALELTIGATILLLLVIWWLWPSHDHTDLSAPPANFVKNDDLPAGIPSPHQETIETTHLKPDVALISKCSIVRDENDYSEEELMIRDVRAALHRGRKIEAIKRVRQSKNIGLAEAHAFVEQIEQADRH